MIFSINDRGYAYNKTTMVGTIIEINGPNISRKLAAWLLLRLDTGGEVYIREKDLTKINKMATTPTNSTVKFLDKWKRVFNVYSLEIHAGVKRNTIAHSISKERRPMDPFEEGKILEMLKKMKRDIEKLKLP